MSRLLESESDNDDSGLSSSANSLTEFNRVQPPKFVRGQTTGSLKRSYLVQNKLEQFSRRLSVLGLASSQEDEGQVLEESESKLSGESLKTTTSGNIETSGIIAPRQEVPMTTSLILTKVPKETEIAIEKIQKEEQICEKKLDRLKVQLKFQPIGSVPQINPSVCKISASQPFSVIISFLMRKLKLRHIHCYINNSFAPNPQQIVGDLWRQFKVDDDLIVSYCGSVAFG